MGPFHERQQQILCDSKRSSFITDFFELQVDTATLIIPSFRMIQPRGFKQRFKPDLLRTYHHIRHDQRQLVHGTPAQLLRAQTEAVAYKPTLARPSARNSRYGIGGGRCGGRVSHRQELSTSPSYCCCCEPEFDSVLLLMESRHDDALDWPSTPCIRVPSPLAW